MIGKPITTILQPVNKYGIIQEHVGQVLTFSSTKIGIQKEYMYNILSTFMTFAINNFEDFSKLYNTHF